MDETTTSSEGTAVPPPSSYYRTLHNDGRPLAPSLPSNVVPLFPLGELGVGDEESDVVAAPAEPFTDSAVLFEVLDALAGYAGGRTIFYALLFDTSLTREALRACVYWLAGRELLTITPRPDGRENLQTVGLTPAGRALLDERPTSGSSGAGGGCS